MAVGDAVVNVLATGGNPENPSAPAQQNPPAAAGSDAWKNDFPAELKPRLEKFKTAQELAKGYVELENFSSKAVQDMDQSERERFMKRLGRPESPDGLELGKVTLPEGLPRAPEADKELQQVVWEMQALPLKQQAKKLHEWAAAKATAGFLASKQAQERQASEAETALRQAWGLGYEANNVSVDRLLKLGGEEFAQFMSAGPGKNPVIRKGLYAISKFFADDTLITGKAPPPKAESTGSPGMVVDFSKSPELQGENRYGRR